MGIGAYILIGGMALMKYILMSYWVCLPSLSLPRKYSILNSWSYLFERLR